MNELARLGCDVAQGFYLSRPLAADKFAEWLAGREDVVTTARDVA